MDSQRIRQELIATEAADWFVRLKGGDLPQDEHRRFADWLQCSPEHVAEYLAAADTWGESRGAMGAYPSTAELLAQWEHEAAPDNVVTLMPARSASADKQQRPRVAPAHRPRSRLMLASAAAVALLIAGIAWFVTHPPGEQRYSTGIGQQLTISLPDGSRIHLNAGSQVRILVDKQQRRMRLTEGEARFHVARDPARPFVVLAGEAAVTALGTVFNVYNRSDRTTVTVVEGRVQVRTLKEDSPPGQAQPVLAAGEELAVLPTGLLSNKQPAENMERVLGWTERRLAFRSRRLEEVIGEFNRFNAPQIRIEDAALADLEVSGAFRADDPQSLLSYLQRHESVRILRRDDEIVIARNP